MATQTRSEDVLGEKWDRCVVDTGVKVVSGFVIGGIFSFLFFKRRSWPIAFGTGTGFGMGYSNAQHDFQNQNTSILKRVKKVNES